MTWKELLVIVPTVLLDFMIVVEVVMTRPREVPRRTACRSNMKQIGLALLMYSADNGGYYPVFTAPGSSNFEPLNTTDLLVDGQVFACPSASNAFTFCRFSNYRYRGSGLKDDNKQATTITMAYDQSGNHQVGINVFHPRLAPDWMNALFLDGHVEGAKPDGSKEWNRND